MRSPGPGPVPRAQGEVTGGGKRQARSRGWSPTGSSPHEVCHRLRKNGGDGRRCGTAGCYVIESCHFWPSGGFPTSRGFSKPQGDRCLSPNTPCHNRASLDTTTVPGTLQRFRHSPLTRFPISVLLPYIPQLHSQCSTAGQPALPPALHSYQPSYSREVWPASPLLFTYPKPLARVLSGARQERAVQPAQRQRRSGWASAACLLSTGTWLVEAPCGVAGHTVTTKRLPS